MKRSKKFTIILCSLLLHIFIYLFIQSIYNYEINNIDIEVQQKRMYIKVQNDKTKKSSKENEPLNKDNGQIIEQITEDKEIPLEAKYLSEEYNKVDKEEQIIKGFNSIKKKAQSIDIIINNAGVNQMSLFQMTSVEKAKSVFNTNFFSIFSLTQKLLKILKKNSYSKIINISSNAAELCSVGRSVYAPSKAAVIAFTKVLSKAPQVN